MISGSTQGGGGQALVQHYAAARGEVSLALTASDDLDDDPREAMRQMQALGEMGRTTKPIHSCHINPDADQSLVAQFDQITDMIRRQNVEFGFASTGIYALHWQGEGIPPNLVGLRFDPYDDAVCQRVRDALEGHAGRLHGHAAQMAIDLDTGKRLNLSHDYARRERLCREMEFDYGRAFTKASKNKAVHTYLSRFRPEVADAMKVAGLLKGGRPTSGILPMERAKAERTKIDPQDIQSATLIAWEISGNGKSFEAALVSGGLVLVKGDNGKPRILDAAGATHDLRRTLNRASADAGYFKTIKLKDILARLGSMSLQTVGQVIQKRGEIEHVRNKACYEIHPGQGYINTGCNIFDRKNVFGTDRGENIFEVGWSDEFLYFQSETIDQQICDKISHNLRDVMDCLIHFEESNETDNDFQRYAKIRERYSKSQAEAVRFATVKPKSAKLYESSVNANLNVSSVADARNPDRAMKRLIEEIEFEKQRQIQEINERNPVEFDLHAARQGPGMLR